MNSAFALPLALATLAAVGNAMFAFGQKRAEVPDNPFLFLMMAIVVCFMVFFVGTFFLPKTDMMKYLGRNYLWIIISGVGLSFIYVGFYFLFVRYGTSYYIVYAVLSIITTSIIVGFLMFRESFNIYYGLSVFCAMITVVLFSLGQKAG